jgi:hypothetical protein
MADAKPIEYLASAEAMARGAYFLADGPLDSALSCSLLAAQSLECVLKCYLLSRGVRERDLRNPPFGHDLNALWEQAHSKGLDISANPSGWCALLNTAYNKPYYFRYPVGINGIVSPERKPMVDDLVRIILMVREITYPSSLGLSYIASKWE